MGSIFPLFIGSAASSSAPVTTFSGLVSDEGLVKTTMRTGEKRPIFGNSSVSSGTLTLTAGAKVSVVDSAGMVVAGFSDIAVTGQSPVTPATLVEVWLLFDTLGLTPGVYYLVFTYTATASVDAMGRVDRPVVQVTILPVVEIAATYDASNPTSAKDTTRRRAVDTDMTLPIWSDGEVNAALAENYNSPNLAAATLLEDAAVDAARQAKIIRLGTDSWDRTRISEQLLNAATRLREQAPAFVAVGRTTAIFTMGSADDGTVGTMDIE